LKSLKPREKNRLRAVFTEEEIARFLDGIDVHQRLGLRDRAVFELMYSSGPRAGELGKLDRGDIDLGERMLIVRDAKWSKDRVLRRLLSRESITPVTAWARAHPSGPHSSIGGARRCRGSARVPRRADRLDASPIRVRPPGQWGIPVDTRVRI
jgi:integrase